MPKSAKKAAKADTASAAIAESPEALEASVPAEEPPADEIVDRPATLCEQLEWLIESLEARHATEANSFSIEQAVRNLRSAAGYLEEIDRVAARGNG